MAEWESAPIVGGGAQTQSGGWQDAPVVTEADNPWKRGMLLPIEKNKETGQFRPAMPQLAINIGNSLKDAAMLPGDVFTGKVPDMDPRFGFSQMSDETLDRAGNAAMVMTPSTPAARVNMGAANPVQSKAVKRLQQGLKADQIPLNQAQSQLDDLGAGAMAMDLGPNLQQKAGGLAAAPGKAQRIVTDAVKGRAADASARVGDDVVKALGKGAPAATMVDDITRAQSAAAKPLYDAVRSEPIQLTGNLKKVLQTPMGKKAFGKAMESAANDGVDVKTLTVGIADYAKQALDDMASSAARAGNNNEARQAANMAKLLRNEVDKMVPAYKAARDAFAGPAAVKDALEIGTGVFTKKMHPAELKSAMANMTKSEKDALIQGARAALEDMMGNAVNDPLIVRNALRKTFNQQKLALVIGQKATDDLLKAMEREITFGATANVAIGNSVTAARQAGLAEAAPHLRNVNPPHGWFDAALRAFNAARNKLASSGQEKANEELSKLLTSGKLPPAVLQEPAKMIDRVAAPTVGVAARAPYLNNVGKRIGGGGGF